MNRREFIANSSKFACACALGSAPLLLNKCTNPTASSNDEDTTGAELSFDLTLQQFSALQENGGSVVTSANIIDSSGLILYRSNQEIKAFTRRCTHQGVSLNPFSGGISICANGHGAQFNTNGQHVSGPGGGSLKSYETEFTENILIVYGG
tara:strand:- start:272 stop:724 length:453 start_codon:yes stop_codon:yes gene_type:complete